MVLSARHEENQIVISVSDDGQGIDADRLRRKAVEAGQLSQDAAERLTDAEALELAFQSGVSTAEVVTDVSGRGVGMYIVRNNIEKLNGLVSIESELGRGTTVTIRLPLTLAIVRALLVRLADQIFAIPLTSIMESLERAPDEIYMAHGQEVIRVRDAVLPLVRLGDFFEIAGPAAVGNGESTPGDGEEELAAGAEAAKGNGRDTLSLVAVKVGTRQSALAVDELLGEQEIVIKSLGGFIGEARGIAGATILGDGRVAKIVEVNGVLQACAAGVA